MLKYKIEDISCFSDQDLIESYNMMCCSRQEQIKGYKNESAKRISLAGELLARNLLSEATGKNKDFFLIVPDSAGKPIVENYNEIYFNISHSENIIAVVVSDVEVGIDIEIIRPIPINLIKKTCNDTELNYIFGNKIVGSSGKISDKDVCQRFFEVWTLKEAYTKCIGIGIKGLNHLKNLSIDLNSIKIIKDDFVAHIVHF